MLCLPLARQKGRSSRILSFVVLVMFSLGFMPESSLANTVVKLGTIRQISGPTDIDLEGEFVYAINFSSADPVRTVRGVKFVPDFLRIPGATLSGPQVADSWLTKPEFGFTPDDNQLEEIFYDIRWANTGAGEQLRASLTITNSEEYKLQILICGNGPENRRWDIRIAGQQAVDEITSLGASPGQSYAIDRATLYTYQFVATTNRLVIEMGSLFGANDGGDRNPIWQALTLEHILKTPFAGRHPPWQPPVLFHPNRRRRTPGRRRPPERHHPYAHPDARGRGHGQREVHSPKRRPATPTIRLFNPASRHPVYNPSPGHRQRGRHAVPGKGLFAHRLHPQPADRDPARCEFDQQRGAAGRPCRPRLRAGPIPL